MDVCEYQKFHGTFEGELTSKILIIIKYVIIKRRDEMNIIYALLPARNIEAELCFPIASESIYATYVMVKALKARGLL